PGRRRNARLLGRSLRRLPRQAQPRAAAARGGAGALGQGPGLPDGMARWDVRTVESRAPGTAGQDAAPLCPRAYERLVLRRRADAAPRGGQVPAQSEQEPVAQIVTGFRAARPL